VFVGLLGKHPAWADHVDWDGIESAGLGPFKRVLYEEGIQRALTRWIASDEHGADRVLASGESDPASGITAFDHLVIWVDQDSAITAVMYPSRDTSGRGNYPLILFAKLPLWADGSLLEVAIARLEQLSHDIEGATERGAVVSAAAAVERTLNSRLGASTRQQTSLGSWPQGTPHHARVQVPPSLADNAPLAFVAYATSSNRPPPRLRKRKLRSYPFRDF